MTRKYVMAALFAVTSLSIGLNAMQQYPSPWQRFVQAFKNWMTPVDIDTLRDQWLEKQQRAYDLQKQAIEERETLRGLYQQNFDQFNTPPEAQEKQIRYFVDEPYERRRDVPRANRKADSAFEKLREYGPAKHRYNLYSRAWSDFGGNYPDSYDIGNYELSPYNLYE